MWARRRARSGEYWPGALLLQQAPSVGRTEEGEREAEQGEISCLFPDVLHAGAWKKGLRNPQAMPSNHSSGLSQERSGGP